MNIAAILVATVVAFVISMAWYSLVPTGAPRESSQRPALWRIALELVRSLVVCTVVVGLANALELSGPLPALALAGALWIAFPAVLLAGSVLWEGVSPRAAIAHSGDWLVKLVAISLIVTLWR